MGIAKSAPEINTGIPVEIIARQSSSVGLSAGTPTIHFDIVRFFNVPYDEITRGNNEEQLKEIEKWTFDKVDTLGDGLQKLKDLEIQLGSPSNNETRYNRIYNWIKMERQIQDLRGRQKAL